MRPTSPARQSAARTCSGPPNRRARRPGPTQFGDSHHTAPFLEEFSLSKISPEWWDYTTIDREILDAAARLTADELLALSRPGFTVRFYETVEDFYLAEALEYIVAWKQATPERPAGICGPIGPTEQLPLVARLVNELELDLKHAHFWGMDEWVGRRAVGRPRDFPS